MRLVKSENMLIHGAQTKRVVSLRVPQRKMNSKNVRNVGSATEGNVRNGRVIASNVVNMAIKHEIAR